MIEPLLLTTTYLRTFQGTHHLTNATGFFFERDERWYLVTSRHVFIDEPDAHHPDRIEFEVHLDAHQLSAVSVISAPLFQGGRSLWRQGRDAGGEIDVAVLEIDRQVLPADPAVYPFTPAHLQARLSEVEVGTPLLIVGFPLGFHDTVHHLPVVRQGVIASSFGLRFQGQGAFLTDARTHRGSSGAAVVMRDERLGPGLAWRLLGMHSARMDMTPRDEAVDESLGLNLAWYADILLKLTQPAD